MDKFTEKLQSILLPVANKLNDNVHLTALKNGMMMTIPLTIIGGVFMLLAQPPVNPETMKATNFFFSFLLEWKAWATTNAQILTSVYNLTIGAIAVYVAFAVAYELSKHYKLNGLAVGFCSLFLFFLTSAVPFNLETGELVLSLTNLGGIGMFYAIIVSFITTETFRFFKAKNIKIKLPPQVPPNVAAPFEALIPVGVLTVVFLVGNVVCTNVTGAGLCNLVYTILKPIMYASASLPSVILISILLSLFWFMGIHANNLVGAVLTPITTANIAINATVIMSGEGSMTPLAGAFMTIFGNWMSYPAMMVAFFLVAKSAHLKSIRKLAIIPDLFNINEPLTFGVPVVMNVLIALPLMVCNIVMCSIAYILMEIGVVGSIYIAVPWTTPGILNLFLATMDVRTIFMWLIMFVVDVVILIPFIKMYDKQLLAEEEANLEESTN
ncbi:MAG: PTS sugar transporter subunit IIC [Coprobacillaceae bacterium]